MFDLDSHFYDDEEERRYSKTFKCSPYLQLSNVVFKVSFPVGRYRVEYLCSDGFESSSPSSLYSFPPLTVVILQSKSLEYENSAGGHLIK